MNHAERLSGIDSFRLLAALGVVCLHVGPLEGLYGSVGDFIRLFGKWAVPFFFMLSGYFLAKNLTEERLVNSISKIVLIFASSSLLMLPLLILNRGLGGAYFHLTTFNFLRDGTYFHLWYLSSSVLGMFLILVLVRLKLTKLLPFIAFTTIIMYLIFGAYFYKSQETLEFFRHLSSLGFIFLGFRLSSVSPSFYRGLVFVIFGYILQAIEASFLADFLNDRSISSFQFLIGSAIMAIGFLDISRTVNPPKTLGEHGAKYSLVIYLIHPYFVSLFHFFDIQESIESTLIIPFAFLSSLLLAVLISRISPQVYNALNGRITYLRASK